MFSLLTLSPTFGDIYSMCHVMYSFSLFICWNIMPSIFMVKLQICLETFIMWCNIFGACYWLSEICSKPPSRWPSGRTFLHIGSVPTLRWFQDKSSIQATVAKTSLHQDITACLSKY